MHRRLTLALAVLAALLLPALSQGAERDSLPRDGFFKRFVRYFSESNQDKTFDKKIDLSVLGGPSYVADRGFSVSLLLGGKFRTDRRDSLTQPSFVQVFGSISTTGFYAVGMDGNTFWQQSKHRLNYGLKFAAIPTRLWGVGYEAGLDGPYMKYERQQIAVHVEYLYRLYRNIYIGGAIGLDDIRSRKFEREIDFKTGYTSAGVGVILQYDSRDVVTDPHRGLYASLRQTFYPGFVNDAPFSSTDLDFRTYRKVWKGGVLAYYLHGTFSQGSIPWTMYPELGGSYSMRGYYKGQYYDRNLAETQLELRQKVYRRIGVAGWIGAGNVFGSVKAFDIEQTLPNYGVGFRWEFKSRMNIRVDYGFGRKTNGIIFNLGEVF